MSSLIPAGKKIVGFLVKKRSVSLPVSQFGEPFCEEVYDSCLMDCVPGSGGSGGVPEAWWCVGGECVQSATEPEGATGGPYDTAEECSENCLSPGVVSTPCCGELMSEFLSISYTGPLSVLGTRIVQYDGVSKWVEAFTYSGENFDLELRCTSAPDIWGSSLRGNINGFVYIVGGSATTCRPMNFVAPYTVTGHPVFGTGSGNVIAGEA